LEHLLTAGGVSKVEAFYRGVSEGIVLPSSAAPDVFGSGRSDGVQG